MLFSIIQLSLLPIAHAVNNGLALTPQMGWNNWNSLGCDVSESLVLESAKILFKTGLGDVGYKYVVLDDCWSDGRSLDGSILVDQKRFPNGMKELAERIHSLGLLYGMYSSAGEMTCARYEGSLDHEAEDAASWASWDVDYLKYDNCFHKGRFGSPEASYKRFEAMAIALNHTQRLMLYSLCNWGEDYVHTWGSAIANSWRISGDIYDHFNRPDALCVCADPANPHCVSPGSRCSVMHILNRVAPFVDRGFSGGWNDLDMLEVGLGGMTDDEYVAHFSLWAAIKSPLLIGADLRTLSAKAFSILSNPAVIAVNQDPLGQSAVQVMRNLDVKKDKYGQGETQIWSGPLYPHDQIVIFLNAADEELDMSASLADIFVYEGPEGSAPQVQDTFQVHDLWAQRMTDDVAASILAGEEKHKRSLYNATTMSYRDGLAARDIRLMGEAVGELSPENPLLEATVPRHGVKMFRLCRTTEGSQGYQLRKQE